MSVVAGTLEIQLRAALAQLSTDMQQAKGMVRGAMASITRAAEEAKGALAALGLTATIGGLALLAKSGIDAADSLNDLSKSTGLAVDKLAGLRMLAKMSGGDLEGTAASINKLSVNIGKNAEKFAALGVTAKDPLEALQQFADVFAAIEDPQLRAALGAEALGKQWASAAPLLAEGGKKIGEIVKQGAEMSKMTAELAAQADEFNDKLVKLGGNGGTLNQVLAATLPLLNKMLDDFIALKGEGGGLGQVLGSSLLEVLKVVAVVAGNVAFVLKGIGTEIGGIAAQAVAFLSGDFGRAAEIGRMMTSDAQAARAKFDAWEASIMAVGTATGKTAAATKEMTAAEFDAATNAFLAKRAAEEKAKAFLVGADAAGKAAKAQKDLGLADAHVVAEMKHRIEMAKIANDEAQKAIDLDEQQRLAKEAAAGALRQNVEQLEFEVTLLGKSNAEREIAIRLRALEKAGIDTNTESVAAYVKRIREAYAVTAEQKKREKAEQEYFDWLAGQWDILGQNVSGGFTSMFSGMLEGTLNSWEDWAKSLGQIFKRTVVDFAGSAMNQLFRNLSTAISSGNFSNLMGGVNPFGLAAAGGGFIGSGITNALGSGQRGQQLGSQLGSAGAMAGFTVAGPVGAIVGAVVGGLAGHFSDPDGLAQRGATFGPRAGATNPTQFGFRSAFGDFSVSDTRWFSDSDMGPTLRQFLAGLGAGDDRIAGLLNPAERDRVAAALQTSRGYSFGEEHGDFSAALGEITFDRMRLIFEAIDPALTKLLEGFTGTNEELINFVTGILGVRSALDNFPLKGLTIDSLNAWKQGGESVVDTFNRVSGQWAEFSAMFRTEGEQMADAQTMLAEGFAALGIAAPATKEEFYNLVAGLDLSTESGRKFFDGLMKLAPAFNTVASAAEAAVARFNSLAATLSPTFGAANARSVLEARVRSWMGLTPGNGAAGGWDVESTIGNIGTLIREGRLGEALTYAQSLGGNAVTVLNDMLEAYIAWQNATASGANPLAPITRGLGDLGSAAERAAAQMQDAKDGLWSYLQGLLVNPQLSPLDPMQQLNEAKRQFYEQLGLAQGGDIGAASGLQGYIDRVLGLGRSGYGSGSSYITLFREITEAAANFARPGGAADMQANLYAEARTGNDIMREVRQILLDIRDRGTADGENVAGAVENAALSTAMR